MRHNCDSLCSLSNFGSHKMELCKLYSLVGIWKSRIYRRTSWENWVFRYERDDIDPTQIKILGYYTSKDSTIPNSEFITEELCSAWRSDDNILIISSRVESRFEVRIFDANIPQSQILCQFTVISHIIDRRSWCDLLHLTLKWSISEFPHFNQISDGSLTATAGGRGKKKRVYPTYSHLL